MSEAKKILELIENVDPEDTAALDEIDARVWCWVNGHEYDSNTRASISLKDRPYRGHYLVEYTRSRDALKSIRPEDWTPVDYFGFGRYMNPDTGKWRWQINLAKTRTKPNETPTIFRAYGPTEELAELHAIIQAIDYERDDD